MGSLIGVFMGLVCLVLWACGEVMHTCGYLAHNLWITKCGFFVWVGL